MGAFEVLPGPELGAAATAAAPVLGRRDGGLRRRQHSWKNLAAAGAANGLWLVFTGDAARTRSKPCQESKKILRDLLGAIK